MGVEFEDEGPDEDEAAPETPATVSLVWASNWASVTAFVALETQWRLLPVWGGGSEYLGLDYQAVDVVLRRRGAPDGVFDDLRHMEAAAIRILNEPAQ